jgi:hypothetical protein
VSVFQRGSPNGAIGVLASLGGPGGTGRLGSGRTRDWSGDEMESSIGVKDLRGRLGAKRPSEDCEDCRCGAADGSITLGRVGRTVINGVSGGDHAGGGDLVRTCPRGTASLGSSECRVAAGGWGSGRDLPGERLVGLMRKWT